MNLFVIPSWYPSDVFPSTGIFYKEQVRLLARERDDWSVGVSLWGSHEPKLWLKASRPLHSLIQYGSKFPVKPFDTQLEPNLAEFFSPAYTWSRKLFKGNIKGIIRANRRNIERYTQLFGKPDVIHAHIAYPAGYIAMQLSSEWDIPYVITEQMSPFPLPSFRFDFKRYLLPPLKEADAVLSVGKNLTDELSKYGISALPASNFIDLDRFTVKRSQNQVPVLLALGRLVDQKGFDLLLKAAAQQMHSDWKLKIGGGGPQESRLRKLIRKEGLEERVELLGELSQSEVVKEMQSCDFFVLSSYHESFGVVLLEAMACGKPVVYTTCGGITSLLPESVGVSCDITANSISAAIGLMLDTYKQYDAQQIRKYVADNYSVPMVAGQLKDVYQWVMQRH